MGEGIKTDENSRLAKMGWLDWLHSLTDGRDDIRLKLDISSIHVSLEGHSTAIYSTAIYHLLGVSYLQVDTCICIP